MRRALRYTAASGLVGRVCLCEEAAEAPAPPAPAQPPARGGNAAQCAKYNTALQRFQWATREERCVNTPGCEFLGHSKLTGICAGKAGHIFPSAEEEEKAAAAAVLMEPSLTPNISAPATVAAAGSGAGVNSSSSSSSVITSIAGDQLATTVKESRDEAEKMAKKIILDALNKAEYRNEFGRVLEYIFSVERVRKPTRDLVYWSLSSQMSVQEIERQALWWKRYFLNPPPPPPSAAAAVDALTDKGFGTSGHSYTKVQLATLISWWLSTPHAKSVINPLLDWTLKEKFVAESLTEIINAALPFCVPYWKLCAKVAIKDALQSTELRTAARDSLMFILKNVGESPLAAGEAEKKGGSRRGV